MNTHTQTHAYSKVSLANVCTLMFALFTLLYLDNTCFTLHYYRSKNASKNSAAERVRSLNEIGTLSYACPSADYLILLDTQKPVKPKG